ncbi:MAG: extracellular solute-binding protein, partial [Ruminiclostridium sp.]
MSKMKKIAAGLMAFTMAASFAACSANNTTQPADNNTQQNGSEQTSAAENGTAAPETTVSDSLDVIPEETVTLDVFSQLANYSGEQVGWFAQVMLEKFNVKLNIINDEEGRFATRMESGDLGDIVLFGGDGDQYQQAANSGLLFDWEEEDLLTNYGPYIKENMSDALEKNRGIAGKVYGFGHDVSPSANDHAAYFYYPDVRFDLYQQIGCPEINTLEDYIPVFEEMQKICPTSDNGEKTYAVSMFPDWDGDMVMFVKATAALYGYDEFGFGLYNLETQEYEDALKEDGMYLRCLKFYNNLYQKGLVDPDSMTQHFEDASDAYRSGKAFFNLFHWMGGELYNTEEHIAEGKAMYAITPNDAKNFVEGLNIYGKERIWAIGAKTDEPELCMAIINWLCTPEGTMVMKYGPKGVAWDYNAEGKAYLTDLGLQALNDAKGTDMTAVGYTGNFEDGKCKINNTTWAIDAINPETGESYN